MGNPQIQQLVLYWYTLREAIAKRHDDDGMATLEVIIIAGGLAVLALGLFTILSGAINNHKASIS